MLELLGDKERKVQTAAENAVTAFRDMLGDSPSLLALFPALTQAFGATKFKTQITALNFVAHIARTLPKLVGNHMIMLVPAIEALLANGTLQKGETWRRPLVDNNEEVATPLNLAP
jgi:hypothetical protein